MPVETHRWIVDGISEQVARCEVDGDRVITVPRWILPKDAREGSVLAVSHSRTGDASALEITLDAAATDDAMARSKAQLDAAPDGGSGDIVL